MKQAHICLDETLGIRYAILPGDPARLDRIAAELEDVQELAYNREFRSLRGRYKGVDVLALSTGIGGSSAGVYVNNRVRLASLFRGIPQDQFEDKVKDLFLEIGKEWGVPFEVVNDGEVTALAGSMEMNSNSVLGISMGTSVAGGYVNPDGNITDWLNELAFVPVDYREGAPADEWSGDLGCAVQYFCQQGVARLAPLAGIELPKDMKFAEQLKEVQKLMEQGDDRARQIYDSIGVCFGYTIARYCEFYNIEKLLILGRVTTGKGGDIILARAADVLKAEFPEYASKIEFRIPDEKSRRHGQAVAAASLPVI